MQRSQRPVERADLSLSHLKGCCLNSQTKESGRRRLTRHAWWYLPVFLVLCLPAFPRAGEINHYVGSAACQPCHEKEFITFQSFSRKSHSFQSIVRMEKGLPPEKIRQCYSCHTTGYGKPGGFISVEQTPELKNAGCEVCHGPGGVHILDPDSSNIRKSVTIALCNDCHTEERTLAFRYKPTLFAGSH